MRLAELERSLAGLSHGDEALQLVKCFAQNLRRAERALAFRDLAVLPIEYADVLARGVIAEGEDPFVLLQGVPYPQPYVIRAVGDPGELSGAIAADAYLQVYREQADDPDIAIGWDLEIEDEVTAPAYDGLLSLSYARRLA